jgi:hypothetical protein
MYSQTVQIVPPAVEPIKFVEEGKPRREFVVRSVLEHLVELLASDETNFGNLLGVRHNCGIEIWNAVDCGR